MSSEDKFYFVNMQLNKLKNENLYRKLNVGKIHKATITINKKKMLNLCSNDYLGIPQKTISTKQLQSSSRLVSGNDEVFTKLEKKLAKHKSKHTALIFPTGYMANIGSISAIAGKGDLILSDELNHASLIDSCRLTDAKVLIYKHNDMEDLERKIRQSGNNKFVITEGVFSMDGDCSKLKEITEISSKRNTITILDDAHGDFILGEDGKGTANQMNVDRQVDLYISSLSKGLGSFGGYLASTKEVVDLCINKSKSFIYTSALPSILVEYSLKRFESDREKQRKKLKKNVHMFSKGLKQIGFEINSSTHIIPIIIGEEKKALDFGKYLMTKGIFAQPIRFPTVPKNQARIRISITAWLSQKNIEDALLIFEKSTQKFKLT